MRVAEFHTYFVGSPSWGFSVWAHNAKNSYLLGLAIQAEIGSVSKLAGEDSHHIVAIAHSFMGKARVYIKHVAGQAGVNASIDDLLNMGWNGVNLPRTKSLPGAPGKVGHYNTFSKSFMKKVEDIVLNSPTWQDVQDNVRNFGTQLLDNRTFSHPGR